MSATTGSSPGLGRFIGHGNYRAVHEATGVGSSWLVVKRPLSEAHLPFAKLRNYNEISLASTLPPQLRPLVPEVVWWSSDGSRMAVQEFSRVRQEELSFRLGRELEGWLSAEAWKVYSKAFGSSVDMSKLFPAMLFAMDDVVVSEGGSDDYLSRLELNPKRTGTLLSSFGTSLTEGGSRMAWSPERTAEFATRLVQDFLGGRPREDEFPLLTAVARLVAAARLTRCQVTVGDHVWFGSWGLRDRKFAALDCGLSRTWPTCQKHNGLLDMQKRCRPVECGLEGGDVDFGSAGWWEADGPTEPPAEVEHVVWTTDGSKLFVRGDGTSTWVSQWVAGQPPVAHEPSDLTFFMPRAARSQFFTELSKAGEPEGLVAVVPTEGDVRDLKAPSAIDGRYFSLLPDRTPLSRDPSVGADVFIAGALKPSARTGDIPLMCLKHLGAATAVASREARAWWRRASR